MCICKPLKNCLGKCSRLHLEMAVVNITYMALGWIYHSDCTIPVCHVFNAIAHIYDGTSPEEEHADDTPSHDHDLSMDDWVYKLLHTVAQKERIFSNNCNFFYFQYKKIMLKPKQPVRNAVLITYIDYSITENYIRKMASFLPYIRPEPLLKVLHHIY